MSDDSSNADADYGRRLEQENRALRERLDRLEQPTFRPSPPVPRLARAPWSLRQWVAVVAGAAVSLLMVVFPPLMQEHKTGQTWGGMEFNTMTEKTHFFTGYGYLFAARKHEAVKEPPYDYLEERIMFPSLYLQLAVVWGMVVLFCRKSRISSS